MMILSVVVKLCSAECEGLPLVRGAYLTHYSYLLNPSRWGGGAKRSHPKSCNSSETETEGYAELDITHPATCCTYLHVEKN